MPDTFTISDTVFIQGRGLVLLCLLDREAVVPDVCVRDELEITTEGRVTLRATVTEVAVIHAPPSEMLPLSIQVKLLQGDGSDLKGATARVIKTPT